MDLVALLTKVVQVQEKRLKMKDNEIAVLKSEQARQAKEIEHLKRVQSRLSRLETILDNLALEKRSRKEKALSFNNAE